MKYEINNVSPKMKIIFVWGNSSEIEKDIKTMISNPRIREEVTKVRPSKRGLYKRIAGSVHLIVLYTGNIKNQGGDTIRRVCTLDHELIHLVDQIITSRGINDSEFRAYTVAELLEVALRSEVGGIKIK